MPTLKASSHHTAGAYLLFNIRYNTVKNNFRKPFPGRINIRGDKKKALERREANLKFSKLVAGIFICPGNKVYSDTNLVLMVFIHHLPVN